MSEGDSFTRSGVVIRRRAASGETARGRIFHMLWSGCTRGLGFCGDRSALGIFKCDKMTRARARHLIEIAKTWRDCH